MKRLRYLKVEFNGTLSTAEIPAFRGAIADKAGLENHLFHNHDPDQGRVIYQYPLIQYKTIRKKPAILCIDQGVDEIHHFFGNENWELPINGKKLDLTIDKLSLNQFTMQVWDKYFHYDILNWIALNQENYKKYQELEVLSEKIEFLEKKLTGNILAFAKGIDWTVDKTIDLKITELDDSRPVRVKDQKLMGFSARFRCNVFLPDFIGLGKNVSLGFGTIKRQQQ